MINRTGLTVSLDHISFEDVIRAAGVSRSTAYRHWPYKELFFGDLVKQLAATAGPAIVDAEIRLIKRVLSEHLDWLQTPRRRHGLVLELIRQLALLDFQSILASPAWRTYLALHATFSGLAEGELRDQIQAALAQAEAARTAQIAQAWQLLAGMFGYRLRPELASGFDALATLLGATMRGLVITSLSTPDVAVHETVAAPFGAAGEDAWSLPAIGLAAIATAFLEPDPAVDVDVEWDEQRLADIGRALDTWRASGA
ncbi:TetR/AcrR family transcriptional regulator [Streptosporangiaceae bacterium NEAU-GS5]|nr:TetR/AcrR family transcriptional regulator [Streptosporangiaceae bacterium NEAU-GS5]